MRAPDAPPLSPPVARVEPFEETWHGERRRDEYRWLHRKDAPDVLDHLRAENAYTDAVMAPTQDLQKRLYEEMLSRIKEDDATVPHRDGAWEYYARFEKGKQYALHGRRPLLADGALGPEEILVDLNELGAAHKFISLGDFEISDDGGTLAYSTDTTGFRQYTLAFKDLRTGAVAAERIERVTSVAFAADGRTVFYVVEDATTKRPHQLYRHTIGEDPAHDTLVHDESDERFILWASRSRSRALILLTIASKTTSEVRFVAADRPRDALTIVERRQPEHEYYVDHRGSSLYIRSNATGRNFALFQAPLGTPGRAHWQPVLAHRPDVMLEGIEAFASFLVLHERQDALPHLTVLQDDGTRRRIPLPESLYALGAEENRVFATRLYRYGYQSPVTPRSVFDFDLDSGRSTLLKRWEVLGGYDPSLYQVAREHAVAADGTSIPLSIVSRRDVPPGTPRPLLLYGYGSYGLSMPASFSSSRVSLLDRGVVYVIAHIRGGGDLGKPWHDAGRMMNKLNTFNDFIASAEHLIARGWTSPDKLVIQGGSAGGLLVGAVLNLRPTLVKAAVMAVPFVDVINTMLDETLPLTVGEFEEWGNPKEPTAYAYMRTYSPYDNLRAEAYPAILVKTSYNDSQVMYWEPAKYVARLRTLKTDANPLLLKINLEPAGHGGQSGRYNQLRELAFEYAFILWQLGLA